MEIIYILAFITLIAIIFGVSMHEAFWGIVVFIVGCFILCVAALFIEAYVDKTKKKINYLKSPKGKAEIKNKMKDRMTVLFIWVVILLPWALAVLISLYYPDTAPGWLMILLAFMPFVIGFTWFIVSAKKALKKNANHKN